MANRATPAMPELPAANAIRLVLLGTPRLELAGGTVVALERRMAALLAMLAVDGPTPRAQAAQRLWPDADDKGARNNLRQRLFRLRQAAQRDVVLPDTTLELAAGIGHDLSDLGVRLAQDPEAAAGELLGNLSFDDCLELADWVAVAREQWALARRNALAEIASRLESEGQIAPALRYAERLVSDDPLLEHAHRRLMRLHYLRGDRAAALTAFERCRDVLKRELKASPSQETLELARTIDESRAPLPGAPTARSVTVLRPPRLIGRGDEWRAIETAWQQQRLVTLLGEPGIGKSRLAGDWTASADGTALIGARPGDARIPYALLARVLRSLIERWGVPKEPWVTAELAHLLPELGAAPAAKLQTLQLQQAVAQATGAAVDAGLVGLVIDDLHFADEASLECLLWLTTQTAGQRLRWLLTVRANEVPARLAEWKTKVDSSALVEILLGPLDDAAVRTLLESLAIPGFDVDAWAAPMARHTGGNPMFILETLLAMQVGGSAFDASALKLPAPANIGLLIERRLDQLSAPALRLARVAALAGPDFSVALAATVLGQHALDIADAWRELEAAQVIRDQGFAHDLIFEATLRTVPTPIARALHKDLAAHLEANAAAPAAVARHWLEAEQWRRAADAYVAAAEAARYASRRAEEVADWRLAATCFDRAGEQERSFDVRCESVEPTILVSGVERATEVVDGLEREARGLRQRVAALNARALTRLMAADHAAGIAAAREAFDLAGGLDSPWPRFESARLLAVGLSQADRAVEALPLIEPFRELVEREGTQEQRGRFWADYSYVLNSARLLRRTAEALAKSIDNARELGDFAEQATSTSNLAIVQGNLGQIDAALELAQRARSLRARIGETGGPHGAAIDMYVGMYCAMLGRYREALDSLGEALKCFEADGQALWSAVANNHRAGLLIDLGQFTRARQALGAASPAIDSVRARVELLAGRVERALGGSGEARFRKALAELGAGGDLYMRMLVQIDLALILPAVDAAAQCASVQRTAEDAEYLGIAAKARMSRIRHLLSAGEVKLAAASLRDQPAQLIGVRPADTYPGEAWWIAYEVHSAEGDDAAALDALGRGVNWVERTALPNVPDEFKDSFLSRNPINRAILTTASRRTRS